MASCRKFDSGLMSDDTREFTFRLKSEKLYLPDVYQGYDRMIEKYNEVMGQCQPWAMVNSKNKLGGVFFTVVTESGHCGEFFVWIWDKTCYSPATHRFMLDYIEYCAESNRLDRIVCRTPDDKCLGRLLERLYFKLEGRFKGGYKCGGRLYTLYQFRRLF